MDNSVEGFLLYAVLVFTVLHIVSYVLSKLMNKMQSNENRWSKSDISLITRRIAAISIHLITLWYFTQALILCMKYNHIHSSPQSPFSYFSTDCSSIGPNAYQLPKHLSTKNIFHRFHFFLTNIEIQSISELSSISDFNCIALMINSAFNIIDGCALYFIQNGWSIQHSNHLLLFHHWILLWSESCVFNMDLLTSGLQSDIYDSGNVIPFQLVTNCNWFVCIAGCVMCIGCIFDLLLAPSSVGIFFMLDGKEGRMKVGKIYKWVLGGYLVVNVVFMRGVLLNVFAFDFLVSMWKLDGWVVGFSFQIALLFCWLYWINLGRSMVAKIKSL